MRVEEAVVRLRSAGVGSPEVARRLGITRKEVNQIMRAARPSSRKEGQWTQAGTTSSGNCSESSTP